MTFSKSSALLRAMLLGASVFTVAAVVATPAMAQLTTSTIRGTVSSGTAVDPGRGCHCSQRRHQRHHPIDCWRRRLLRPDRTFAGNL